MARIFAGDLIDFFEDTQGAKRNVFQIADGRPNKIEAAAGCRRTRGVYGLGGRSLRFHAQESSTQSGLPFALTARPEIATHARRAAREANWERGRQGCRRY